MILVAAEDEKLITTDGADVGYPRALEKRLFGNQRGGSEQGQDGAGPDRIDVDLLEVCGTDAVPGTFDVSGWNANLGGSLPSSILVQQSQHWDVEATGPEERVRGYDATAGPFKWTYDGQPRHAA